jgi:hypothetical protein
MKNRITQQVCHVNAIVTMQCTACEDYRLIINDQYLTSVVPFPLFIWCCDIIHLWLRVIILDFTMLPQQVCLCRPLEELGSVPSLVGRELVCDVFFMDFTLDCSILILRDRKVRIGSAAAVSERNMRVVFLDRGMRKLDSLIFPLPADGCCSTFFSKPCLTLCSSCHCPGHATLSFSTSLVFSS